MVTEEQYARDLHRLGAKIHYHDGIWWKQSFHLYSKPVFEFKSIKPGSARPAYKHALLGYSHQVPERKYGNRTLDYMVLDGEDWRSFSLDNLPGKKRNQVRKGLKSCQICRIDDIEMNLEMIRQIYISQSKRHLDHHERPETPYTYYSEQKEQWRKRELLYLTTCGRELWGARVDNNMVGFLVTSQIENVRLIEKVKTHSDFMKHCPSDALYYIVLINAAQRQNCEKVINPGIRGGGLDHYKEQFLFRKQSIPYYVSNVLLFYLAENILTLWKNLNLEFKFKNVPTERHSRRQ